MLKSIVAGMQAFTKLNNLAENRMNELRKHVQKYNCSAKPSNLSLPKSLNSSEICKLDSPEWISLQQLKEECSLDPLDNVKIAAIRQKGLLDSANFERKQLERHMHNVLAHFHERSDCLKQIMTEETPEILCKLPILHYNQVALQATHEYMKENFSTVTNIKPQVDDDEFDLADITEQILSYDSE